MKKKHIIIGASAILIYLLMSNSNKAFAKPTASNKIRQCDPFGCGTYLASRGNRKHEGEDYSISPGESVFSPISGTVTRIAYPYASDMSYKGVEIKNDELTVKIFYMVTTAKIGSTVKAGDLIGTAQNIAAKYGSTMVNHIHVEIRNKEGKLIQPSTLF